MGWLDDRQFRELSPADRAVVVGTAGRAEGTLSKFDQERLQKIHKVSGVLLYEGFTGALGAASSEASPSSARLP